MAFTELGGMGLPLPSFSNEGGVPPLYLITDTNVSNA
jgi:hypothetical protein